MATFNQQGQQVGTQNNGETIYIGQVQSRQEFTLELKQLESQLNDAIESKLITGEAAIDALMHVKKAALQVQDSQPDKNKLVSHLTQAKALVTSVDKITLSLGSIIASVGALF